jgi:cell division protein FtsB
LAVDQLEAMSHNLPAILAEFCRMEREIISQQAQISAMQQTIKQLTEEKDDYKEKYEKYVKFVNIGQVFTYTI